MIEVTKHQDELQMLIGGSDKGIDVIDWFDHTVYSGGYHPTQNMVHWFWEVNIAIKI